MDAGDVAPSVGLLTSADDWVRLKARSRLLSVSVDALAVCYEGRDRDRVYAEHHAAELDTALHNARRREQGLRLAVPAAALLGGLLGAGVAVGVAWGYPVR